MLHKQQQQKRQQKLIITIVSYIYNLLWGFFSSIKTYIGFHGDCTTAVTCKDPRPKTCVPLINGWILLLVTT